MQSTEDSEITRARLTPLPFHSRVNSATILVQDFDIQRRTNLHISLRLAGYKVLEAINSRHAEVICCQNGSDVDLVVADDTSKSALEWRQLCPYAQLVQLPFSTCNLRDPLMDEVTTSSPASAQQLVALIQLVLATVRCQ